MNHAMTIQPVSLAAGSRWRTVDATLRAQGCSGAVTIYYLLVPPGTAELSAEEIRDFSDRALLASGGYARGVQRAIIKDDLPFTLQLPGRQVPDPYTDETGVVDGIRYEAYLALEGCSGTLHPPVHFAQGAIGMPFAAGAGTRASPYELRALPTSLLARCPDLMPGHPLNATGVLETARMLHNIQRLRTLWEASRGLHGQCDALSRHYVLATGFDLSNYAAACGGRGWQPIGMGDVTGAGPWHNAFRGSFTGGGAATPITNLSIQIDASRPGAAYGLFGLARNALLRNVHLIGARIQLEGAPESDQLFAVGGLLGHGCNVILRDVNVGQITVTASPREENGLAVTLLGGVAGLLSGSAQAKGVSVRQARLKSAGALCAQGGMAGAAVFLGGVECHLGEVLGAALSLPLPPAQNDALRERLERAQDLLAGALCDAACRKAAEEEAGDGCFQALSFDLAPDIDEFYSNLRDTSGFRNLHAQNVALSSGSQEEFHASGGLLGVGLLADGALLLLENSGAAGVAIQGANLAAGGVLGLGLVHGGRGGIIVNDTSTQARVQAGTLAGGFLGAALATQGVRFRLNGCASDGSVRSAGCAGGFAGSITGGSLCCCEAKFSRVKGDQAGGFTAGLTGCRVEDSIAVGVLEALEASPPAGGFAARIAETGLVRCCFAGALSAAGPAGGLVGLAQEGNGPSSIASCFVLTGKLVAGTPPARRILAAGEAQLANNYALASFALMIQGEAVEPAEIGPDRPDGGSLARAELEGVLRALGYNTKFWDLTTLRHTGRPMLRR